MNRNIKDKIIFIILLLLMNYRINIIGSMSLTEIYVVTQIPRLLKWVNTKGKYIPNLQRIVKGFYILIVAQCVSEFMVHNSVTNAIKGIAVTIMALFIMLFFLEKIIKDTSLIKLIPISSALALIIFGDQFGFANQNEGTYFKFYVAPIIIYLVCFITMIPKKIIQNNIKLILLFSSIFIIIGGARSLGFSLFFTLIFYIIYSRYKSIKIKRLVPGIIAGFIIVQSFLTFIYMPKVKSGDWGSEQNRTQFEKINWNSNIFAIILAARSDFLVSAIAFIDKPLWGHGSWAIDKSNKYYYLQAELLNEENTRELEILKYVPNHSVVMGKGTANGIFAFIIFLWIFISMYRIGLKGLNINSIYCLFLIWTIISSFQHLMFGPQAILKNNGALAFAIMFALYYNSIHLKYLTKNETEKKIISSNCYI